MKRKLKLIHRSISTTASCSAQPKECCKCETLRLYLINVKCASKGLTHKRDGISCSSSSANFNQNNSDANEELRWLLSEFLLLFCSQFMTHTRNKKKTKTAAAVKFSSIFSSSRCVYISQSCRDLIHSSFITVSDSHL